MLVCAILFVLIYIKGCNALIMNTTFTWIFGSNLVHWSGTSQNQRGVYTTTSFPGARGNHCLSIHDRTQRLYLFGGDTLTGSQNDLWAYDIATGRWAYLSGDPIKSHQIPTWGIKLQEGVANTPSSLMGMACAILPFDDNLYVHGGVTNYYYGGKMFAGETNALWRFNTTSGNWAWVSGNGVVPSSAAATDPDANVMWPANRDGASMSAHSSLPILFLFGGSGWCGGTTLGSLNDLWTFNASLLAWSRLKGQSVCNDAGNYSSFGTENDSNMPQARYSHSITATSDGNIYLFGGYNSALMPLSDLWKFSYSGTKQWMWIAGTKIANEAAVYGNLGEFSAKSTPGARAEIQLRQLGTIPVLILMSGAINDVLKADVWSYDMTAMQWAYVGGSTASDTRGIYGYMGVTSINTMPGSRSHYGLACLPKNGSACYIFGGSGLDITSNTGDLNDLWRLDITVVNTTRSTSTLTSSTFTKSSSMPAQSTLVASVSPSTATKTTRSMSFSSKSTYTSSVRLVISTESPSGGLSSTILSTITNIESETVSTSDSMGSLIYSEATISSLYTSLDSAATVSSTAVMGTPTDISTTTGTVSPTPTNYDSALNLNSTSFVGPLSMITVIFISVGATVVTFIIFKLSVVLRKLQRAKSIMGVSPAVTERMIKLSEYGPPGKVSSSQTQISSASSQEQLLRSNNPTMSTLGRLTQGANATFSGVTVVQQTKEFSLPGYLQFQLGVDFAYDQQIADGGSGKIFLGAGLVPQLMQSRSKTVVVKVVAKSANALSAKTLQAYYQEVTVMHYLAGHQNIAQFLGWSAEPLAIIVRYYQAGTLSSFKSSEHLSSKLGKLQCLLDIAHGLEFMHSKMVAHRDIKADNILVDVGTRMYPLYVLADFGLAAIFAPELALVRAFRAHALNGLTIVYAAPEVLRRYREMKGGEVDMTTTFKGDVYSTAMLVYLVTCLGEPWTRCR